MQNRVMILVLLGTAWITTRPIRAQQTPTAVFADPAADKQFPPGLSVLTRDFSDIADAHSGVEEDCPLPTSDEITHCLFRLCGS
jgi:hypothetical protein